MLHKEEDCHECTEARSRMIRQLREFSHERNRMDTVIAEERRTMFNVQHDMSKSVEVIDSNVEALH
jgi:hypothetical protein